MKLKTVVQEALLTYVLLQAGHAVMQCFHYVSNSFNKNYQN